MSYLPGFIGLVALVLAAAAVTVVILIVLRQLLWLSQGLFLSAGVFFMNKRHKNRLASVIFVKMDLTISPLGPVFIYWSVGQSVECSIGKLVFQMLKIGNFLHENYWDGPI